MEDTLAPGVTSVPVPGANQIPAAAQSTGAAPAVTQQTTAAPVVSATPASLPLKDWNWPFIVGMTLLGVTGLLAITYFRYKTTAYPDKIKEQDQKIAALQTEMSAAA